MKTKDLIAKLQEADPSGELHCCIDNGDIEEVNVEPAYWDGALNIVERDEAGRYTCAYRQRSGSKVVLSPIYVNDIAGEQPGVRIKYLTEEDRARYEKDDLESTRWRREINFQVERDAFSTWVFEKIQRSKVIPLGWVERIKSAAEAFYLANRGPDVDGKIIVDRGWKDNKSWRDRLETLWEEIIRVEWDSYSRIIIEMKEQAE